MNSDPRETISIFCLEAVRLVLGFGALTALLLAADRWWAIARSFGLV